MNKAMQAIIKKDFQSVASNRRLFTSLLIVPLVLTIFLPSIFVLTAYFAPDDPDIQTMLKLLPVSSGSDSTSLLLMDLIFNYILPVFFLVIPIMASSIMAASSFVGEKEKHTLETLLYSPLTLHQIFRSKVLASFLLSMLVSLLSFLAMTIVVEAEILFLFGSFLLPKINWLILLALLSPGVSLIAVTLIVRGSAKARTMEESQHLLILSFLCIGLAWLLLKKAVKGFTYEMLLR